MWLANLPTHMSSNVFLDPIATYLTSKLTTTDFEFLQIC